MLTEEEFKDIQSLHEEKGLYYLFLNYGCPIKNPEFKEKFDNVSKALKEYIEYMKKQSTTLGLEELYL